MRAKLLHFGGKQLQRVYENLPDVDKQPLISIKANWYDIAISKLDEYFEPGRQFILERCRLRKLRQEKDERFAHFVLRIRQQLADCGLEKYNADIREVLTELFVIDVIVEGCVSEELRRRILQKDVTLAEVEAMGAMMEGVEQQVVDLTTLNAKDSLSEKVFRVEARQGTSRRIPVNNKDQNNPDITCFNCGAKGHIATSVKCKARDQKCRWCKKLGHFEASCRKRSSSRAPPSYSNKKPRNVRLVEIDEQEANVDQPSIEKPNSNPKSYYCFHFGNESNILACVIGGVRLEMLVDSGSDVNIIHSLAWEQLKREGIKVHNMRKGCREVIKGYGSNVPLRILGTFSSDIKIGMQQEVATFFVVEEGQRCILGDATAKALGVLKIGTEINHLTKPDRQTPFGKIKDVQVQIHMDPTFKPVFQPVRRVPLPYESAVNTKLDKLLEQDIIEVKTGPTTWVSPLVVVGKANGEPRICLDLRRVNEAVMRERHPMPVVDELLARIGKGLIRSRLDIRDAFLQTELAPASRDITTFITSRGLFRFKRLPFGLVSAPEIFQKVMEEILAGCEGTVCYLDDIYVEGENLEQHNARLNAVYERLQSRGVVLNHDKCVIGVAEVQFLGHIISAAGIRPSPSKIQALVSIRPPVNSTEVKSFLGLANYMNKFINNLATLDEPLRKLTEQTEKFNWREEHQQSFDAIKEALSNSASLGYFNSKDHTSVIVDASPSALGAILVQTNGDEDHRVICYASKSLTKTEKRYCQTEKEALAAVWGVERFQMYLLGKEFDLVTDCKALQYLFTPRSKPCARIERWVLRLQAFDYKIKHIAGEKNVSDVLSRLSTLEAKPFDYSEELFVNEIASAAANNAAIRWEELEIIYRQDDEIIQLLETISNNRLFDLPIEYRVIAQELCQVGNILMRGDRIVIPKCLREKVLALAHEGHPGIQMMKNQLRASVWWPKIDMDVETYVKKCRGCTLVSAPSLPEPMVRHNLPSGPWEDLAIDFLGPLPEGQFLLVVIDYYSRYFEVCEMSNITAESTIEELRVIFSRFGIPITLTADNAPQLSEDCEEFSTFCKSYGVKLINTVPYWPQMNGEVERQNRTILKRLQIAQELGQDWRIELQKFLLTYRTSAHSTTGRSPAEMMFGRKIRNKLPKLTASRPNDEETRDRDCIQKEKGREYGDKKRRARVSDISVGDYVLLKRMRKDNKLSTEYINEEFVVLNKRGADITVKSIITGKEYRRNSAHVKKIEKTNIPSSESTEDTDRQEISDESSTNMTHNQSAPGTSSEHLQKRKSKEPAWFESYVPHYVKKC
ncbi:uncharacterized protein K02A2.6-like [Uranotaenia lowii]|uniref:uncharacterized protein K02A2.6-like n=1 Tax=Uranotaenia lowii TaxID=190385 RepID=UPI00247A3869|nr:uncharacterized protein K02A2.6-like [Uranotaenia lowii]